MTQLKMPVIISMTAVVLLVLALSSSFYIANRIGFHITDVKMANAIDDKLMPVGIMTNFPKGTSKVECWFSWENAKIGTGISAKWRFLTDDIAIFDHKFAIPRKSGHGSVRLMMPEGKTLPSGKYRTDLFLDKRLLRSITFNVD